MRGVSIRPLVRGEQQVMLLLTDAALAIEDLDQAKVHFLVAVDDVPIGAIGLETFVCFGLLRSLVVDGQARRSGSAADWWKRWGSMRAISASAS